MYSPASCDDEMKDLLLQRRIRMLNWLEPQHLDIPLKLDHPGVQELVTKGQQGALYVRQDHSYVAFVAFLLQYLSTVCKLCMKLVI